MEDYTATATTLPLAILYILQARPALKHSSQTRSLGGWVGIASRLRVGGCIIMRSMDGNKIPLHRQIPPFVSLIF